MSELLETSSVPEMETVVCRDDSIQDAGIIEPPVGNSITIDTSNEGISAILSYDNGKWNFQLTYNSELQFPIITDKEPIIEAKDSRDTKIVKQLSRLLDVKKDEAENLLHEIMTKAGQRKAELFHLLSDDSENEDISLTLEEKYPEYIITRANDVLQNNDAFEFIVDVWRSQYAGNNDSIGYATLCSIASTYITSSKGINVKVSGKSGFGKSTGITKMFALTPPEKTLITNLSGKAVYYDPNLKEGMCLYVDDVDLTKADLMTTIKQSTSDFQNETTHQTVINGEGVKCGIPPRVSWVMSAVNGFDDEQLSSRFLCVEVEESIEYQKDINRNQKDEEFNVNVTGKPDNDTLTCRCIFEILGKELYEIRIPFAHAITWNDIEHPRNFPMFKDIVKAITFFNIKQREKYHDFYLSTPEDFYKAKQVYQQLEKINSTKLTADEIKVLECLEQQYKARGTKAGEQTLDGKIDRNMIAEYLGKTSQTIKNILHGKDKNSGLLLKVPGLHDEQTKVPTSRGYTSKYLYWYAGKATKSSYQDVVGIDDDIVDVEIGKWKKVIVDKRKTEGLL